MADWGIKVSKPGQDVKTAADKDLLFTSKDNTLKVDIALSAKKTGTPVTHSYGYKPLFMAFYKSGSYWYPDSFTSGFSGSCSNTVLNGSAGEWRPFIFVDKVL